MEKTLKPKVGLKTEKLLAIEDHLKEIKGMDQFDSMKAHEMFIVSDIVIPQKSKVPDIVMYTRVECLNTYLKIYCNKMTEVIKNGKLLIHFFYKSLSGAVLTWCMNLDENQIKKWRDLVEAFIHQCKFNIEMT